MNKYVTLKFHAQYKATIGTDFLTKDIIIDNKRVSLQAGFFKFRFALKFICFIFRSGILV